MGGSGDPSPSTALGVLHAMRAAVGHRFGTPELAGRHVVVSGVGKVGGTLVADLVESGAAVTVADVNLQSVESLHSKYEIDVVDPERAHAVECDVYRAVRPRRGALADDDPRTALLDRRRRRQQSARHARVRRPARRPLDPVRARLPRQCRWGDQHRRGTRRLRRGASAGPCGSDLRPHPRRARDRRQRGSRAGDGRPGDRRSSPRTAGHDRSFCSQASSSPPPPELASLTAFDNLACRL